MNFAQLIDEVGDAIMEQLGKAVLIGIFIYDYVQHGKADLSLLAVVASLAAGSSIIKKISTTDTTSTKAKTDNLQAGIQQGLDQQKDTHNSQ